MYPSAWCHTQCMEVNQVNDFYSWAKSNWIVFDSTAEPLYANVSAHLIKTQRKRMLRPIRIYARK